MVPLGSAIRLVFSDYPDPDSFPPQVTLSAPNSIAAKVTVDLIGKSVLLVPVQALAPQTSYTMTIGSTAASLALVQLGKTVTLGFSTGTAPGGGPNPPPDCQLATRGGLLANCNGAGCHAPSDFGGPAAQLDLTLAAAASALVGVPAQERPGLKRVLPHDPSRSYLLRKLLGTPDIQGGKMPLGTTLTDEEIQWFSDWIATGAL